MELRETTTLRGGRVDRARGVITNVKVLGRISANGREYTRAAIDRAAAKYEGVRVNVDHDGSRRSYRDRIGRLVNVRSCGDGLYADLQFNPKHPLAEQLLWDAEHSPASVGLSHDARGRASYRDGRAVVEEIESVRSVDLVAEPATTNGLFESEGEETTPAGRAGWLPSGPLDEAEETEFLGRVAALRGQADESRAVRFAEGLRH